MGLESSFQIAPKNRPKINILEMTSSSNYFGIAVFLLPSLVTGPMFMSISLLVLELWQFSLIGDRPEIQKSEIPLSEFS